MMIKKTILLFCGLLFMLSVCSCEPVAPESVSAPESRADSSDGQIDSNAETNAYRFSFPVREASAYLNIWRVDLPEEIEGLQVSAPFGILGRDKLLVLLISNTEKEASSVQEVGTLDSSGNYSSIYTFDNGVYTEMCAWDESYLIVKLGDKDWTDVGLYAIEISTGKSKLLCHYSPEMCKCPAIDNAILLKDGKVYFDNIISKPNKMDEHINLYCYDLATDALTVVLPDSENPLAYHNTVLAVKQNELGKFRNWTALDGSVLFQTDERLSQIASCDANIFALMNKNTDQQKRVTTWSIRDLKNSTDILETEISIDRLAVDPSFVCWKNYSPETPYLYLPTEEIFLKFSEISPAENSFLLDQEGKGGLLANMKSQDGKYLTMYYAFTLK